MTRTTCLTTALILVSLVPQVGAAPAKYTIKTVEAAAPNDLKEPFRKLLSNQSVQLLDAKGAVLAEVWFRKEVPAKPKAELPKTKADYGLLQETTFLGAIRFPKAFSDYRQQSIKPGVYTMRLGIQPMNGNHMGTAPYNEFCLLMPADQDASPDPLASGKELNTKSKKASGTEHAAIMLLFPNPKPEEATNLASKGDGHWVLFGREEVSKDGQKVALGIGLTLVGHSPE
ncbi:hypothetical protein AYO40_06535 [Planctomycetaceae bacterium SCGC AG-212-D15]|nr:hypothetical protein AYO40_06535 [Planctomycetaceae bacterium SCGC AG-212-D15]